MKFLVDAQLPRRLAVLLSEAGHDAVHTSDFLLGNRTTDHQIAMRADREDRVVVTKDRDFWVSHVLRGSPRSLLIIATGNITNAALLELCTAHLCEIVPLLKTCVVVEMGRDRLVGHTDSETDGQR
ncbi:DUF5615 family PIN-like protein [Nocardia sp. NPDC004168]|uniref:DUF5615 family PIN-like protein n=1 Tax=Nocardia sp. NPDC004168 TaxID=3154452 RepID=UPI0033B2D1BB